MIILHSPCEGQETLAMNGELNFARAAIEEFHAKLLLESTDLLTQGGGRDAESIGRATEVQLFSEGAEIPDHLNGDIHSFILAAG